MKMFRQTLDLRKKTHQSFQLGHCGPAVVLTQTALTKNTAKKLNLTQLSPQQNSTKPNNALHSQSN